MDEEKEYGHYCNPIIPGFNPDPSIVRVGDDFFCITSTFEFFPGIPVYHSTDLIKWTLVGHVLTRRSQLDMRTVEPGAGIWASTIRYRNGTFYVTTSKFDRYRPAQDDRVPPRGFYVSTTNIWRWWTWSDPVYFDNLGYDQDLFWDDDDKVYLSTTYRLPTHVPGSRLKDLAIHISEIDLTTGRTLTTPKMIKDSPSGVSEGSHIIKKDGWYYLFTAEGGTESGHHEVVSRSSISPYGPWEQARMPLLQHNGPEDDVHSIGHADLVEDQKGNWWAVLLGVRATADKTISQLGRETFLVPVTWEDGWPVFNNREKVSLLGQADSLYKLRKDLEWRWFDNFDSGSEQLSHKWYHKCTPLKKEYSLKERPGFLRLYGGPYSLSWPENPTAVFVKQTAPNITWTTELEFEPENDGYEAGTVIWWSQFSYASIGVKRIDGKKHITFRSPNERSMRFEETTALLDPSPTAVKFVISGFGSSYKLGYANTGVNKTCYIGEISTVVLTQAPPIGGTFTGAMFGLYSQGNLVPNLSPADFAYASMEEVKDY